jgi:signal transduction protein with GAF and PtsI domain
MMKEPNKDIYQRELSTLLRSSSIINSSLQINDVLDSAMKAAEEFMEAEASSVFELDTEKGEISVRLARGEKGESIQARKLKPGEGVAGWVMRSGKPIIVEDVQKESRFSDRFDRETGFRTRSLICVPLTIREETIGALQVINKKNG